jgi:hypothetical protein
MAIAFLIESGIMPSNPAPVDNRVAFLIKSLLDSMDAMRLIEMRLKVGNTTKPNVSLLLNHNL